MPTSRRHYRITVSDVLGLHEIAIRETGGRDGVLNLPIIEAAVARPFGGYYRAIERKAAALVQSLACGHGFQDGNKRTALMALVLFVDNSGYRLLPEDDEARGRELEDMFLDLVTRRTDFEGVVAWLKARLVKEAS